jgi:hypothetical protein
MTAHHAEPTDRTDAACSAHAWACPVIMKTQPDRVAWTCGRCGAVAIAEVDAAPAGAPVPRLDAHAVSTSVAANAA